MIFFFFFFFIELFLSSFFFRNIKKDTTKQLQRTKTALDIGLPSTASIFQLRLCVARDQFFFQILSHHCRRRRRRQVNTGTVGKVRAEMQSRWRWRRRDETRRDDKVLFVERRPEVAPRARAQRRVFLLLTGAAIVFLFSKRPTFLFFLATQPKL